MSKTLQEEYRSNLLKSLAINKSVDYKEIMEIANAFQVSSGQSFAIGKTQALLDFLAQGNEIIIENFQKFGDRNILHSINDLMVLFKNLDEYIDLETDDNFESYFK